MDIEDFKFIKKIADGSNSAIGLYECLKPYKNIPKGKKVIIKIYNNKTQAFRLRFY